MDWDYQKQTRMKIDTSRVPSWCHLAISAGGACSSRRRLESIRDQGKVQISAKAPLQHRGTSTTLGGRVKTLQLRSFGDRFLFSKSNQVERYDQQISAASSVFSGCEHVTTSASTESGKAGGLRATERPGHDGSPHISVGKHSETLVGTAISDASRVSRLHCLHQGRWFTDALSQFWTVMRMR